MRDIILDLLLMAIAAIGGALTHYGSVLNDAGVTLAGVGLIALSIILKVTLRLDF